MVTVRFRLANGDSREVEAPAGDTVMDAALDHGVPGITAQCGGGCTCCTCHCYVAAPWRDAFDPPHPDEVELLAYAWEPKVNSRLSCQLILSAQHEGVEIQVPAQQN